VRRLQIEQRDAGIPTPTMNSIARQRAAGRISTISQDDNKILTPDCRNGPGMVIIVPNEASFLLLVDRIHSNKPRDAGRTISWAVREYLAAQ
jgi:hypothetical protein